MRINDKLRSVALNAKGTRKGISFYCPGCKAAHSVCIEGEGGPLWTFNGNHDAPTFTPSLLVTWNWGEDHIKEVCHSFITDGNIQFLGDCTHDLANQTVPIPDWPNGNNHA